MSSHQRLGDLFKLRNNNDLEEDSINKSKEQSNIKKENNDVGIDKLLSYFERCDKINS